MAGHSHWSNIKHKKKKNDRRRAKLFGKLSRKIISAARRGGGDLDHNVELRNIVERARDHDMPKENIQRAIKKGTGDLPGVDYEDHVYEGYGPGGIAIIVEVTTDNKNRSISQIRKIFDDHGGNVGERGCVSYQFEQRGYITVPREQCDEMELFEVVVEAGGEDLETERDDVYEVFTDVENFAPVKKALERASIETKRAGIEQIPETAVPVEPELEDDVISLLEELEDHRDVQNVYSNFVMDDDTLAKKELVAEWRTDITTILGLDPGLAITGYGVLTASQVLKPVSWGTVTTDSSTEFPHRLERIYDSVNELQNRFSPDVIAIEKLYFSKNVKTAIKVGQARGVIVLAATGSGGVLKEYSPLHVKKAITGSGNADKKSIQLMLRKELSLSQGPTPDDAADALAVAYCHYLGRNFPDK